MQAWVLLIKRFSTILLFAISVNSVVCFVNTYSLDINCYPVDSVIHLKF